ADKDIEAATSVDSVNSIKDKAISDIKEIKNSADSESLEQLISDAKTEFSKKHDEAVARLKNEFGKDAVTTEVDNAFDTHKNITGTTVEEVKANELAAERELAKGEVKDTGANAKNRVNGLKHKNGNDYTEAEKNALRNQIEEDVHEAVDAKGTIDQAQDTAGVDKARETAVNKIVNESIADSPEGNNVIEQDPEVLRERLAQARESAIKAVQDKFGKDTDTSSIIAAFKDAQAKLNEKPKDLATELNGEKEIAQGALTDAKAAANKRVDGNSDYSDAVKGQIKQQIQKDYDDFSNRIKESAAVSELITQKRDDGIAQIYRDATESKINNTTENVINGGGGQLTPVTPAPVPNNKPDNKEPEQTKSEKVVLMHNAYLYNSKGQRANGITLGTGSVLDTYGIETINGDQYYVLVDKGANNKKYYVAIGNVKSTAQKLKHNAYVYNQYGQRVKKAGKLKSGEVITTYGSSVKIRGKKYFIIAKNRYVKAANIASQDVTIEKVTVNQTAAVEAGDQSHIIINKKVMHNAYLYDQNGVRANGLVINAGSNIDVVSQKVINKKLYYALENGLYIAAGNIDAKKLKLKHNAYVYSKYGNRLGKKVLKKRKSIKTYGNPVKIKGKKYYTMTTSKFVKKANVKG
ncbi:SLAP domain-containing protein, partial [Lactobacillus sp. M0396]|uniref:SLAP domain-containing protein n=1 Tax=Lactobacillus sp. M0396 TaxID=2751030 RepID=UPI0018DB7225